MVKVIIPAGFLQERTYALHVLLYELLGLQYSIAVSPASEAYEVIHGQGRIRIADCFLKNYSTDKSYLTLASIPEIASSAQRRGLNNIVCIFGKDQFEQTEDTIECGVDLIASTFFMLTRWEEYVDKARDKHGRFPGPASLAYRLGFLHRPVVDEYAALLKKWLLRIGVPRDGFKKHEYHLSLQCDVDTALYWPSPASVLRKIGFRLFRQGSAGGAFKEFGRYLGYLRQGRDPYDTFDRIMDIAERHDEKATFFFPVGGENGFDNKQTLHDKHVFNVFAHVLMRGHEAGVHFSYQTAEDGALMLDERTLYENKHEAVGALMNRQHYLRCSVPETWHSWEQSGIQYDFTMGYPESPGFRCGICHPFPLFDIHQRRMLNVYERPLIAMDVTFRMYLESTPEQTIETCKELIEKVRKHQGEFVLLWHNSSFAVDWEGWEDVLERITDVAQASADAGVLADDVAGRRR